MSTVTIRGKEYEVKGDMFSGELSAMPLLSLFLFEDDNKGMIDPTSLSEEKAIAIIATRVSDPAKQHRIAYTLKAYIPGLVEDGLVEYSCGDNGEFGVSRLTATELMQLFNELMPQDAEAVMKKNQEIAELERQREELEKKLNELKS